MPVGVPVPYPLATPPTGWFNCNGAIFDKSQYPKLALVYPSGTLPDLRGEFIRGWDNGRGVDIGRGLLSNQTDAIRNITGSFPGYDMNNDGVPAVTGAFIDRSRSQLKLGGNPDWVLGEIYIGFDISRVVPTANENRPRNIVFNYIVRAV